jgi:hypothetical protein
MRILAAISICTFWIGFAWLLDNGAPRRCLSIGAVMHMAGDCGEGRP